MVRDSPHGAIGIPGDDPRTPMQYMWHRYVTCKQFLARSETNPTNSIECSREREEAQAQGVELEKRCEQAMVLNVGARPQSTILPPCSTLAQEAGRYDTASYRYDLARLDPSAIASSRAQAQDQSSQSAPRDKSPSKPEILSAGYTSTSRDRSNASRQGQDSDYSMRANQNNLVPPPKRKGPKPCSAVDKLMAKVVDAQKELGHALKVREDLQTEKPQGWSQDRLDQEHEWADRRVINAGKRRHRWAKRLDTTLRNNAEPSRGNQTCEA